MRTHEPSSQTPAVQTSLVHWLLSTGTSALSATLTALPLPSHWLIWQLPVDCVEVGLPAAVLKTPHVPAEQVMTSDRMYDIPQLDARGYYEEVEHPVSGPHRYPGWPLRMTPGPSRHHRFAPPTLGQHNEEILRGLGLTDDELEELRARHVIGETALNA